MKIKIIDKEKLIFEKKEGQKRRGWIKVQFKEGEQCEGCVLFKACHYQLGDSICSQMVTETLIHGNLVLFTPRHYRLCRV
jgi:hypothetical protein